MFQLFSAKAWLSQGIVLDYGFGLTLDGILSSLKRKSIVLDGSGSLYDGGLDADKPREVELPLAKCLLSSHELDEEQEPVWHWLASAGIPFNYSDEIISLTPPDQHRLFVKVDEKRVGNISVQLPKEIGGSRGRFRNKVTPVLNIPAAYVQWWGVGDIVEVKKLLSSVDAVGARRGSGEGAVYKWEFNSFENVENAETFVHLNKNGTLNRPVPLPCARILGAENWREGMGGLRPPVFHKSRQLLMALPNFT